MKRKKFCRVRQPAGALALCGQVVAAFAGAVEAMTVFHSNAVDAMLLIAALLQHPPAAQWFVKQSTFLVCPALCACVASHAVAWQAG